MVSQYLGTNILNLMPVSNEHKCLFIHIPKTGGTSIEASLKVSGDWKVENINTLFGLIKSKYIKDFAFKSNFLQHLTYEQVQKVTYIDNKFTSFSFVRNPWDKMVSIYSNADNNLIETASKLGINIKDLSFNEFIEKTEFIEHIHLEHQYKFVCNREDEIIVDFIGKFESLNSDFNKLCKIVNMNLALPHKNKSVHAHYRSYYNNKTKSMVYKRYKKDIELFKYTF